MSIRTILITLSTRPNDSEMHDIQALVIVVVVSDRGVPFIFSPCKARDVRASSHRRSSLRPLYFGSAGQVLRTKR